MLQRYACIGFTVLLAAHTPTTGRLALAMPRIMQRPATYYVNSTRGSDENSGLSPSAAWASIARVNRASLRAGDSVLFASGCTFAGPLRIGHGMGGAPGRPVEFGTYGPIPATIDGAAGDGIELEDCACVTVRSLVVRGCGRKSGSDGAGVRLRSTRNVILDGIEATGFRLGGVVAGGDTDLRISRVNAHDNGFAGINVEGGYGDVSRSRNVTIVGCRADGNPGDPKVLDNHSGNGIIVGGVDGCLIDRCEASGNGWDMPRTGNGPVGIWGWNCDRLTIQCCISHDNKSPGADGGGFDFDGGVTNSVMQYNLSYGNQGCGILLCQFPGATVWKNNVVRYNVSIDDGAKNFHSGIGLWKGGAGISGAQVYNNTVVNSAHAVSSQGPAPAFTFRDNIFIGGDSVLDGDIGACTFRGNLYWSPAGGPLWRNADAVVRRLADWLGAGGATESGGDPAGMWADPRIVMPRAGAALPTDPASLEAVPYCRLEPGSPCLGAGSQILDAGERDFYGNTLPRGRRSIGACQLPR